MASRKGHLTEEEQALWTHVTTADMSDEEECVIDGQTVWLVSPPAGRCKELPALFHELDKRKMMAPKPCQSLAYKRVPQDKVVKAHDGTLYQVL